MSLTMPHDKGILGLVLVISIGLISCGTGPWIVHKKLYETHLDPVFSGSETFIPRTDGYYIQTEVVNPRNSSFGALIFLDNGYVEDFRIQRKDLESEIRKKITQQSDTLYRSLAWWKINKQDIVIEHYAEMKRMIVTWNYFQRGSIVNDSIIQLKDDASSFDPITYRFVQTDSLPVLVNNARYIGETWYESKKHEQRN